MLTSNNAEQGSTLIHLEGRGRSISNGLHDNSDDNDGDDDVLTENSLQLVSLHSCQLVVQYEESLL